MCLMAEIVGEHNCRELKMMSSEMQQIYKDVFWQLEWGDIISVCINKMFVYPQCLTNYSKNL